MKRATVSEAKHPRYTHRVRYTGPAGKTLQAWFKNETDALAFAKERDKEQGVNGSKFGSVGDDERAAVAYWRDFVEKATTSPPDLLSVVKDFAGRWNEQKGSVTIKAAYEKFLDHQEAEGGSVRHIASLKSRVGRLSSDKGGELVALITAGSFSDWLNGLRATRADKTGEKLSLVTRDNLKKSCRTFFSYCMERGWTSINPVPIIAKKRTREHRLANEKAPEIMMPADVEKFLRMVEAAAPKILPFWCFKFFAGIRDSEAAQLTWEMVDMPGGKIHLPAAITKTGDARTVEIQPVLAHWLASHAQKAGPVAPASIVARRFAYNKALKRLRKPLEKGGAPQTFTFPSNAARHSFGTFHLYHFRKAGETALQLGHKGDPAMLHKHYKNPAAEEHAAAFWSIGLPPAPAKKKAAKARNVASTKKGRESA
jgi:integrase